MKDCRLRCAGLFCLLIVGTVFAAEPLYVVKEGDTLWEIARAHGTSVNAIQAANGGNIKNLRPGKNIRMPK